MLIMRVYLFGVDQDDVRYTPSSIEEGLSTAEAFFEVEDDAEKYLYVSFADDDGENDLVSVASYMRYGGEWVMVSERGVSVPGVVRCDDTGAILALAGDIRDWAATPEMLSALSLAAAAALGDGNVSLGIREALRQAQR